MERDTVSSDTTAVREAHRFDETSLERYLRTQLPGFRGPMTVRQFEGGQSNPTFLLQAASGDYVVRKKPPGQLLPSAHQVEREYRVMAALQGTSVPVPPTLLLCDDPSVIGTPFFVMQRVRGRVFRHPGVPGVTPSHRRAVFADMAAVLARLHSVDVQTAGLTDLGKPGNYFARQIDRWGRQYVAAKTDDIPAMDRLIAWLPEHIPPGEETTIVHGDYRVENLIVDPVQPRIAAVVDWELATLGHPLADLAYNCLTYHLPPEGLGLITGEVHAPGVPTEREYVEDYCRLAGRSDIQGWSFCLAFSMFRLASILQGVYARGLQGNAASAKAIERGGATRAIADAAWSIAARSLDRPES